MKKVLLFIIFHCLVTSSVIAQNDTSTYYYVRGGIGLFYVDGLSTTEIEFEYIIPINRIINFGVSSDIGYGKIFNPGNINLARERTLKVFTIRAEPNIYLQTIPIRNFYIYTSLGIPFFYTVGFETQNFFNGDVLFRTHRDFAIGLSLGTQLNYNLNQDTSLSLRFVAQYDMTNGGASGASLNIIKKINPKTNE